MQGHRLLNGHAATGGPVLLGPLTPVLQTAAPSQRHPISSREAKSRYHQDDDLNVVSTLACVLVTSDSGGSPGGGHGNTLQYSCLENPVDRGAGRATVRGVVESDTTEQLTLSQYSSRLAFQSQWPFSKQQWDFNEK